MACHRKRVLPVITAGVGILVWSGVAEASSISVFPDKSLLWQIINFLVLIWLLNFILYRPIRDIVARRQEHMSAIDKKIKQFQVDAQQKESAFAGGIKDARAEGLKTKTALVDEGTEEEKRIIEAISKKTQQALAEQKVKISQDVQKAATELQQKVEAFAFDIGRKILGREIS